MTQLQIVNKALDLIGVMPIASMSENSPAALLANRVWTPCRKEALKGHDWPFATSIVALSTATYTIVGYDWSYAYNYPTGALEVWRVYYSVKDKKQAFRRIYDPVTTATYILSNIADAIGEFTYDVEDTSFYDAHFCGVLAYLMAANMAKALTGDDKAAENMLKTYTAFMSDAKRMSSYESGEPNPPSSVFVDARDGSSMGMEDHYTVDPHPNG